MLTNIYFVPFNLITIKEAGGPMSYGLLMLPILLSTNLLLITAGLTFKNRHKNSIFFNYYQWSWANLELILALDIIDNT